MTVCITSKCKFNHSFNLLTVFGVKEIYSSKQQSLCFYWSIYSNGGKQMVNKYLSLIF